MSSMQSQGLPSGREEWAIPSNIATPGQWQTVAPIEGERKNGSLADKGNRANTKKATMTTHDNAPEFQDDDGAEDDEDLRNFKIQEKQLPVDDDDGGDKETNLQGWFLVIVSSFACILGASVVFIDKCWSATGHQSPILQSRAFLSASMALASGVLLFSSLAVLLPASRQRLGSSSSYLVYLCFFGGALFTLALTKLIHALTPDAIHACGGPPSPAAPDDDGENAHLHHDLEHGDDGDSNQHDIDQTRRTASGSAEEHHRRHPDENQPIKCNLHQNQHYGTTTTANNHGHRHHDPNQHHSDTLFREAHFRLHPHRHQQQHHNHHHHHHDQYHEHDDQTSREDYQHFLRMGIQTAVAIGVHKFPEGLIMFVSNRASAKLGWSITAAMSIHNLTEGFMIALPLYFALRSRMAAFGWAALLGGLSQPIGAVLGLVLMRNIDQSQEDVMFGTTFALVSGMMTLITIQSMLPQAIKADTDHRYVLPFFFLGIFFVGLTAILKSL
ncbi:ZIP zinc transporter-domain-containing protein [Zychaea mexicana]|uniref:ZIP zinc transporter-domain-containing protein n=1 Tax=Zychaea mexicana TaxID=64656 RepID=UPI0022FDE142|nr:ZIP zinc transporter-domain-containing protein [Zychaea mexicana]KAI9496481.1 ZIP zinc transporter-domain-containing protein [Zychaea mexicana]